MRVVRDSLDTSDKFRKIWSVNTPRQTAATAQTLPFEERERMFNAFKARRGSRAAILGNLVKASPEDLAFGETLAHKAKAALERSAQRRAA